MTENIRVNLFIQVTINKISRFTNLTIYICCSDIMHDTIRYVKKEDHFYFQVYFDGKFN